LEKKSNEGELLFVLTYFNWAGTPEEFKEFANRVKSEFNEAEGIGLIGIFIPSSEWHYVLVWNVTAYVKVLQTYKAYSEKYGHLKFSLGKDELFHTLEEVPFL
jgi:hypothetical protein